MAKKKSNGVESGSPNKSVPAMYPPPGTITLPAPRVIAFDPKTNTITFEGSPPVEWIAAAEFQRKRFDLNAR